MLHSILAHWKAEAAVSSVLIFLGLLLHEVTGPKILGAMVFVSDMETAFNRSMLTQIIFSSLVGLFIWWLQKRVMAKRTLAAEGRAADLQKIINFEREQKDLIARGHEELMERVTKAENRLREVSEKIVIMDQTVSPLMEATKLRLIAALTHPDSEFKIPDQLLSDIRPPGSKITPELAAILKERETSTNPAVSGEEKLAAAILPAVVELAFVESQTIGPITNQVVSSPVVQKVA